MDYNKDDLMLVIAQQAIEIMNLKKDLAGATDTIRRASDWRDRAKRDIGAHLNRSFDDVWKEVKQFWKDRYPNQTFEDVVKNI